MSESILRFAKGYKESIERGEKKITIRKGIVKDIFPYSLQRTNLGFLLKIKSVLYTTFGRVPISDYKDDGFKTHIELMQKMGEFYTDVVLEDMCTVIRFEKGG
ncbi:hypothetical protein LCGC14_1700920 [marine sediment metagenome]|uniref:ASCH domain-containing protein n=1 Tax=marine sediment metagenome TaxID=412755 RepID=A0A0F9HHR2_9ZZZZ